MSSKLLQYHEICSFKIKNKNQNSFLDVQSLDGDEVPKDEMKTPLTLNPRQIFNCKQRELEPPQKATDKNMCI